MSDINLPSGPGSALTIILLVAGLGVLALAAWRHGRPPEPEKGPRMIPWMLIVLVAALAGIVGLAIATASVLGVLFVGLDLEEFGMGNAGRVVTDRFLVADRDRVEAGSRDHLLQA